MSRKTKNKDLKGWQENLIGSIASFGILIFLAIFYDNVVFTKGETTNSKVMRHFFSLNRASVQPQAKGGNVFQTHTSYK
jgi:hypothetical protein